MEADIFDAVHSALLLQTGAKRLRLNLGSSAVSQVNKVIWAVWDYIIGPDIHFIWELQEGSKSPTPLRSSSPARTPVRKSVDDDNVIVAEIHVCGSCGRSKCECPTISDDATIATLQLDDVQLLPDVRELSFDSSELTSATGRDLDALSSDDLCGDPARFQVSAAPDQQVNEDRKETDVSDDNYVALHSLSSEICRLRMETAAVDFKLLCVPDREMLIAAFIFSAKHKDTTSVQSMSLVLKDSSWPWYQQYEKLIEAWMGQIVQRIKVALFVDTFEEILSCVTSDLTDFLGRLSFLEANGLHTLKFNISETLLASTKLGTDEFLRSCISAHLVCQSHTVVIGSDVKSVNQMIRTLALFSPPSDYACSSYALECNDTSFCPYLKIQGLKPDQMKFVSERGSLASWPWCLVNVDSKKIHVSSDFAAHQKLRAKSLVQSVEKTLGLEAKSPVKLSWKVFKSDETIVRKFLQQMDLLSQDCDILIGFVDQFCLSLMYKSIALIDYVEEITGFGADPTKLNVMKMRRALDLTHDGDFWAVLATADRLKPHLAAFTLRLDSSASL